MFRFCSNDRNYNEYKVYSIENGKNFDGEINALEKKLLNFDTFDIKGDEIVFVNSPVRQGIISGVLVLENNKTYGKYKKKFLYQCYPDDCRLPVFLVPFEEKIKFSKKLENRYVAIKYLNWEEKHPIALIEQNIGCVNDLPSFYEYQLYCRSLNSSIQKFNKDARDKIRKYTTDTLVDGIIKKYNVEDRRKNNIISIDPKSSKDFDDAIGIKRLNKDIKILSIYIANVAILLDFLDLWDSFSQRIATIYLPDRKIPMLPTILSDNLCSLKEGESRFALALDLYINEHSGEIIDTAIKSVVIKVTKNYTYDTKEQESNILYCELKPLVEKLNKAKKLVENYSNCSHDVIASLMILMNKIVADKLYESKCGIFRAMQLQSGSVKTMVGNPEIKRFLEVWGSSGGNYCKYDGELSHDVLKVERYIHLTSPIRRLVDLLNIIKIQEIENITLFGERCEAFYKDWTSDDKIIFINDTMRSIRKVQNDCSMLSLCTKDPTILQACHSGYIFNKIKRNDHMFKYQVYFVELKLVKNLITCQEVEKDSYGLFKIHLFTDESRMCKKLRISFT